MGGVDATEQDFAMEASKVNLKIFKIWVQCFGQSRKRPMKEYAGLCVSK